MTDSWRLKVDRAEKHLKDIQVEVMRYAERHPYEAFRARQPRGKRDVWVYRLRITEQPDPMLALMVGDCVHNLRSALDHLAVALAPRARRYKAGWPIELANPWATNPDGSYVVASDETRRSFQSALKGIPEPAAAIIKRLQPYEAGPDNAERTHLSLIQRIWNADKHRELTVLSPGIRDLVAVVTTDVDQIIQTAPLFGEDGAEVAKFDFPGRRPPSEAEVHVKIRGAASVAVKVGDTGVNWVLPELLERPVKDFRGVLFPSLEKFL